MRKPVLFLDDGGVISENSVRSAQWRKLVGPFMSERLGGNPEDWAAANAAVMERFFAPGVWETRLRKYNDYASFQREYSLDWMWGMCRLVGVGLPGEEESIRLTDEATLWVTPQVNAGFPGAADAIKTLHSRDYSLYTASGEASRELEGYLGAIGVRECFVTLYGTDLVDMPPKSGRVYYERVFAGSGVLPEDALVVDDNPSALAWATSLGARGVLVGKDKGVELDALVAVIGSLAELPGVLEELG